MDASFHLKIFFTTFPLGKHTTNNLHATQQHMP